MHWEVVQYLCPSLLVLPFCPLAVKHWSLYGVNNMFACLHVLDMNKMLFCQLVRRSATLFYFFISTLPFTYGWKKLLRHWRNMRIYALENPHKYRLWVWEMAGWTISLQLPPALSHLKPEVCWTDVPNKLASVFFLGHRWRSITPLLICNGHFLLWGGINLTRCSSKRSQWRKFGCETSIQEADGCISIPPQDPSFQDSYDRSGVVRTLGRFLHRSMYWWW